MRKIIITHLLLLLLAAALVIVIVNQTDVTIINDGDLLSVSCGWPFEFVTNDQSWRNPSLPWKTSCIGGEWGDNLTIIWSALIIDIVVIYIGLALMWLLYWFEKNRVVHNKQ